MTKIYPALVLLIISIVLTGDAYGNTHLKRPFGQKGQTFKNIGAYSYGKKVAKVFRPSTKKKKKRGKWARKKSKNNFPIMLGGLGAVKPEYEGSNKYEFSGIPFIDMKYKKIFFLNYLDGLGVNVLYAPNFRFGIALNYYESRDFIHGYSDSISLGLDTGVFGSISFGRLSAKLKFRQDISGVHNGQLVSGRLSYRVPSSKKLRVNLNVNLTHADDEYMETYFLHDGGGVKDMGGGAIFMYLLDKNWTFITIANYTRLLNDAAKSPLVEYAGSKNPFWLGLGFAYRF
ncbi:MipA/OmpV family protein [Nitrospinaceae bacterium]|nr:MipA/OmpV family protein [Nitrospinaceae bacterium]